MTDMLIDVHGDQGEPFRLAGSCSDTEAMALLWIRTLLTQPGTDPMNRERGTALTGLIGSGYFDAGAVQAVASLAVTDATSQFRRLQSMRQIESAKQIADVALLSVKLLRTSSQSILELTVQLVTREGRAFVLPVRIAA